MAVSFPLKFDIVIVQLHLSNISAEQYSTLEINVKFNNNNIKITSSRINVCEFKPGRSFEFNERISVLKENLLKNPLECHFYHQSQHLGTCTFLWPSSFVNSIVEEYGREMTHCDEAYIDKENQKVGKIKIIARLQVNCNEFEEHQVPQSKLNKCESNDNVVININPNDMLFAVSDTKCGSFVCSDIDLIAGSDSAASELATYLDLSDLRHMHGKTLKSTDVENSIGAKCCKKKKSSTRCKGLIKNLLHKINVSPCCSKNASKPQLDQLRSDCISESKFSSCSSTDSYQPFYCNSDENASEDNGLLQKDRMIEKPRKKYCLLCNENITWLPKLAACPKCGFRSLLHSDEKKPYDYTLTANDILQEYANGKVKHQASDVSRKNSQQIFQCRCTCKNGKTCAHCRIKQLCQDIFQPNEKHEDDCDKCETKSSDLYNICKTNSQACRPYLMKVFDGLKDLFDMTEGKQKNEDETNELNTISKKLEDKNSSDLQGVNKNKKENESVEKNLDEERKQFLVKNFQKQKACSKKSLYYDNNTHRKYPTSKMGHKTCLSGRKTVPRNMGWLWNAETNESRIGWRPGAIRKPIRNLMKHFLKRDQQCCGHHRQIHNDDGCEEKDYTKQSTLHICKKDGVYYITLRPLRPIGSNIKPIQFQITKNPFLAELRQIKQHLKEMGFPKCTCHKPISVCCCRSLAEKKKLEYQCCKECQNRELPSCTDNLILSDTTDSEAEFEFGFTPPAGMPLPSTCFKKRKKVSSGTQYEEGDWNIKPKYPKPLEKYFKLHNCAVGNRFGKAFGPYGKKGYVPGAFAVDGIYGPGGILSIRRKGKDSRAVEGSDRFRGPDGKFDMVKYLEYKALTQPSKEEIAKRKRQKMELLRGMNPPLLCKVERRRKPIDLCAAYDPCNAICLSDDRVC